VAPGHFAACHLREGEAMNAITIDAARLWQSLMDLARIGATPLGGVRRITLTDLDREGRDRVVEWFRAAGLEVRVDPIGNNLRPPRRARSPRRPSSRAATSTRSPRAVISTALTACWRASKSSAR
jgi:hypothetical protein